MSRRLLRAEWEWPFAHHLNTPPPMWDALTVAQTDRGINYLEAVMRVPTD